MLMPALTVPSCRVRPQNKNECDIAGEVTYVTIAK
jgi:hypothetical protein